MNKPLLQLEDFEKATKKLRCDIPAIKAVAEVESRGQGFYEDGFPVILFERHKFHQFTNGKYDKNYPEISNKTAGGYGKAGQNQRRKFNLAFSLDPEAAMKSCSWGKFQIMGFNYKLCGFSSVGEFVDAMKTSEGEQLLAFVNFVISTGLGDELRNHKWADFAKGYNGKNYKINNYDSKLASAYSKFSKQITTSKPLVSSQKNQSIESASTKTEVTVDGDKVEVVQNSSEQPTEIKEVEPPSAYGFIKKIRSEIATLLGINVTVEGAKDTITSTSWMKDYLPFSSEFWSWVVTVTFVLTIIYLIYRLIHYLTEEKRKQTTLSNVIDAHASKDKNDVVIKSDIPPATAGESVSVK